MATKDAYERLGEHLSHLGMGYPYRDDLITILKENFTPLEAKVAFALPNGLIPLQPVGVDDILSRVDLPREELVDVLESLSKRGLIFARETKEGENGYALHQVGFGFPQSFFWKGEETAKARKMAPLLTKYFNREVTREAFSPSETKAYRYIPVKRTIDPEKQGVYPYHMMEKVIEDAKQIALAHCPCRMIFGLRGGECKHPKEVCMKFNDMAQYVIERGLAKEITKEEALEVIKISEEAGLVHFVDNAEGDIRHNCNCCGCACWNVGNIRRRKVPRDVLMATYFLRETDEDACIGCGACVEICPVDALELDGDVPVVDEEWCIGCGVCDTVCPSEAIAMKMRPDRTDRLPAANFAELHEKILEEKREK